MATPDYAIGLSVETTGSVLGLHGLLAVGVAAVDIKSGCTVVPGSVRRWTLNATAVAWDPQCIVEVWSKHPDALAELTCRSGPGPGAALTPAVFAREFNAWLETVHTKAPPSATVLVSDSLAHDSSWVSYALSAAGLPCLDALHPSCIDLTTYLSVFSDLGCVFDPPVVMDDVPPPNRRPEVNALYVAVKYARLYLRARFGAKQK